MKLIILFLISFYISGVCLGQDTTISQAFKNNKSNNIYPLIKPKTSSYPLMAGYILQKYANEDDPFAQHELGLRHLLGNGFTRDTAKAVYWIRKAAEKNLTAAKYNYAILFDNGIGVDWNPFKAFRNVQFAAVNGMPEAQFFYGIFFTDNLVVNRNYSEAYKWFSKAAESNIEPAIEARKKMEESGLILTDNPASSDTASLIRIDSVKATSSALFDPDYELDFFEFEMKNADNAQNFSKIYNQDYKTLKSNLGIDEIENVKELNDSSGLSLVEFAAESGSPEGLLILAKDYEFGVSRKRNLIKSVRNYIKAYRLGAIRAAEFILKIIRMDGFFKSLKEETEKKNADAMYVWAGLTALGFDYQLTNKQAIELLEDAVKLNHVYSLIEKGLCYYNGTLVEKNRNKAFEYWERAALMGSVEAKVRLAFSRIIERYGNDKRYLTELQTAAEQGSVLAQTALAYCYENGIGIKRNRSIAARLYRKASHRGSEIAYNSLQRMYDELRPDNEEFIIYKAR